MNGGIEKIWQDGEKVHQRRSRSAQKISVSKSTPPFFACCGLAGTPYWASCVTYIL